MTAALKHGDAAFGGGLSGRNHHVVIVSATHYLVKPSSRYFQSPVFEVNFVNRHCRDYGSRAAISLRQQKRSSVSPTDWNPHFSSTR